MLIHNHAIRILASVAIVCAVVACEKKQEKETILKGKAAIWTDETISPIVEDQVMVFESQYDADIDMVSKSETEVINAMMKGEIKIAILSRQLTADELKVFSNKKLTPRVTKFATDGVALIVNSKSADTLIALADVLDFMKGKAVPKIKGLAFDNPNSSTLRYLNQLAGVKSGNPNIYSFHNNVEAIKYVSENDGIIGVIGLNWLTQPTPDMQPYLEKISVVSIKDKGTEYVYPSQNNLAEKKYPLARDLFIANCQGFSGLGMGFASFAAGETGQRIVLKSGLLPATMPGRKIAIKNNINQ
jgi:phosphate transport system substrate-binding protein